MWSVEGAIALGRVLRNIVIEYSLLTKTLVFLLFSFEFDTFLEPSDACTVQLQACTLQLHLQDSVLNVLWLATSLCSPPSAGTKPPEDREGGPVATIR